MPALAQIEPSKIKSSAASDEQPIISSRLFALDVLRGIAIILVIFRHWPSGDASGNSALFRMGWVGVDLFFVLSGFLISSILFKEYDRTGSIDLSRFWLRRGFKIWPAYFAAFGGVMAIRLISALHSGNAAILHGCLSEIRYCFWNILLVQNYLPAFLWPHTWSLAVEEHFYIAFPPVLLGLAYLTQRRGGLRSTIVPFAIAVCSSVLILRLIAAEGARWQHLYFPTHLRADALAFGVLLGAIYRYWPPSLRRVISFRPLVLLGVTISLALPVLFPLEHSTFIRTVGFTLIYLGFGGAVLFCAVAPYTGNGSRVARGVAWIGRYSYTIYLAHGAMSLLPGYDRVMDITYGVGGMWMQRMLFCFLALSGGVFLARAVEQPALKIRERLFPSSAK